MQTVIGMDIGGTNIRAGLVTKKGEILKLVNIKTEAHKGKHKVISNIMKAIAGVISDDTKAIGIGAPGPINIKKKKLGDVVNVPLGNVDLLHMIKKRFKRKVIIENDASCFTLGEAYFGAGKGLKNVVGLTLGTGVGGGVVINKKMYKGRGNAAELGHTTIKFDGAKSKCGNNGCIESYVNKRAINRYAKGLARSPEELFRLALKGNRKALRIWKDIGFYLGVAIANFINAFDPDIVVLGGNISKAWRFFSKTMKEETRKRALVKPCKIVKSELGSKANVLGASVLVQE